MLISEIFLQVKKDSKYADHVARGEGNFIVYQKGPEDDKKFKWQHEENEDVSECLQQIGEGEDFSDKVTKNTLLTNLRECRNGVREFLAEKDATREKLWDFYQYVLAKVSVVCSVESSLEEGINTFTRLNAGGKPLGHLELIKGWLFSKTKQDNWSKLNDQWDDFWEKFNRPIEKFVGQKQTKTLVSLMGEETFLIYFFFVQPDYNNLILDYNKQVLKKHSDTDGLLPAGKLSDFLLRKSDDIFQNPSGFLHQLSAFAEKIIAVRAGKYEKNVECENRLKDAVALSKNQTQPLLFLLRCYDNPRLFALAVEIAFRWIFVFTTSLSGKGTTGGAWRDLSNHVALLQKKEQSERDLLNAVELYAQDKLTNFWRAFIQKYESLQIDNDRQKIKTILLVLEAIVRQRVKEKDRAFYHELLGIKDCDVDHLAPEKGNHGLDEVIVQSIGNAALLDESTNRALQNEPFESVAKQKGLAGSNHPYFTTHAIVTNPEKASGRVQRDAMGLFTTITAITPDTVEKHQQEMRGLLEEGLEIP